MTVAPTIALPVVERDELKAAWRQGLVALAVVAAAILLLYRRDAGAMAAIWWDSSTFNHCLLIGPIIAWLIWQRWPELRRIAPRPWWAGLGLVAVGGIAWLLGEAAGVALARHLGLVVMLQGSVIACLGPAVAGGIAFPVAYALFLIPFGEELVPPLQTFTAAMSMALLQLAGVPAHLDGVFITIPNGWFEVAEACSGVKFLVAMVAFGALAANVCFRSWRRRIAFMALAIAVPVLANGLRAWGTIYVAHLTTADFAAGFDHVFYGWIFFAIVIAAVLGAAWPFFDRPVNGPWIEPGLEQGGTGASQRNILLVPIAAAAMAAVPLLWSDAVARNALPLPEQASLPDVPGWERVPVSSGRPWTPHFAGADRLLIGRYQDRAGRAVDLAIAVFARQAEGKELVGYGQGAVGPESDWAWVTDRPAVAGGRAFVIAAPGSRREVLTFYRLGDVLTGNETRVKLETLRLRLLGGDQRAVALLLSAEGEMAEAAINAFRRALRPVERVADRAAGR